MLRGLRKTITFALAVVLAATPCLVLPGKAHASASCDVQLSPTELEINSVTNVQFTINNTGDEPISWLQVIRPDTNFTVIGITVDNWTDDTNADGSTLTDGVVTPGDTLNFQLGIQAGSQTGGAIWNLLLSSSGDSSNAFNCSGDMTLTVVDSSGGGGPPPSDISGISATNLTPTSATINWHTDALTGSVVYYGKTTSYGRASGYNPSLVNDHSVVLSGLSPDTVYHYRVSGNDSGGVTHASEDNTFKTPPTPPPPPPPVVITPTSPTAPKVTVPKTPGDTTPPTIVLETKFDRPFKTAPQIRGTAADNAALANIEYSTDGGRNWLPADKITGLGTKQATFSFTPPVQDDGNYTVVARAIDGNGNIGASPASTLVIDRLPPQVGPLAVSYGPEILNPDKQGAVSLVAGSDYHLTASAIGGATSIQVEATSLTHKTSQAKTFTLAQSLDSSLWNGLLSFQTGGVYKLTAHSLDGAGNVTDRQLLTVAVSPAGQVLDKSTKKPLKDARITLFYLEPASQTWQVWQGAPYDQVNPQPIATGGTYSLMVPAGHYYLQAKAPLHYTFTSDIFEVTQPTAITSLVSMQTRPHLPLGAFNLSLPDITWQSRPLLVATFQTQANDSASLVGATLPDFSLPTIAGGQIKTLDLIGKPTLLTILTTWSPNSQDQLPALAQMQRNQDLNTIPVFSQEHPQLVGTYLKISGYPLIGGVDADGVLVPKLGVGTVPRHIFIDRTGIVKKVIMGIYSKEQLLNELGGL